MSKKRGTGGTILIVAIILFMLALLQQSSTPVAAQEQQPSAETGNNAVEVSGAGTDLDVLYIERTPKYTRYKVTYFSDRRMCSPENPNYYPYSVDSGPQLCPGEAGKQRWPNVGEIVTFTSYVKYTGAASLNFDYAWYIDGTLVKSGTHSNTAPGTIASESITWQWQSGSHKVKFVADQNNQIAEPSKINNQLEDHTDGITFIFYVEQSVYNGFNSILNVAGTYSFEDWLQAHISALNSKLQSSGALDTTRIDKVVLMPDGTLPRGGTSTPQPSDPQWDGTWGFDNTGWTPSFIATWAPQIQVSLIHEWSHQMGMAHSYDANLDIASENTITNARLLQRNPDIVGTGGDDVGNAFVSNVPFTTYFVDAINSNYGYRRGYYADYLFDIPSTNTLLVQDAFGNPLRNAQIKIWQSSQTTISGNPVFQGTTDANGNYIIPNQNLAFSTTTATGHVLKSNPFGNINVGSSNGLFLIETSVSAGKDYAVLTIHDFNLKYWQGSKTQATYVIKTTLASNADPTNLALGKAASASSNSGLAGKAVDGDTTTQTNGYWEPLNQAGKVGDWWQVDLGSAQQLYKIRVYAGPGNSHDWYAQFHIETSSTGQFSGEQQTVATESNWETSRYFNNWDGSNGAFQGITYTFGPVSARYVRIKSDVDQSWVKLEEAQIYGTTSQPPPSTSCGNGVCDTADTIQNCPADCMPPSSVFNNAHVVEFGQDGVVFSDVRNLNTAGLDIYYLDYSKGNAVRLTSTSTPYCNYYSWDGGAVVPCNGTAASTATDQNWPFYAKGKVTYLDSSHKCWFNEKNPAGWVPCDDVYVLELATGNKTVIESQPYRQVGPSISGNWLVWYDSPLVSLDPYSEQQYLKVKNLADNSPAEIIHTGMISLPIAAGDYVYYQITTGGQPSYVSKLYNLKTKQETTIPGAARSVESFDGKHLVSKFWDETILKSYDIDTGTTTVIGDIGTSYAAYSYIVGNKVYFENVTKSSNLSINSYDFVTGKVSYVGPRSDWVYKIFDDAAKNYNPTTTVPIVPPPSSPPPQSQTLAYIVGYGLRVIDVTNPTSPQQIGGYQPGNESLVIRGLDLVGTKAYLSTSTGLSVLDVAAPQSPSLLGSVPIAGNPYGIDVVGSYAYVATDTGLNIVNVANPASMSIVGQFANCTYNRDVKVVGTTAYLACNVPGSEMMAVDVSDVTKPRFVVRGFSFGPSPTGVDVQGNNAYLTVLAGYVTAFNLSKVYPGYTIGDWLGQLGDYRSQGAPYKVVAIGNRLYVAAANKFEILDTTNTTLSQSSWRGSLDMGNAMAVAVNGNYAYVADNFQGLKVVDVSNPASSQVVGTAAASGARDVKLVTTTSASPAPEPCGNGVCDSGESLYTCFVDCKTASDCNGCAGACPVSTGSSASATEAAVYDYLSDANQPITANSGDDGSRQQQILTFQSLANESAGSQEAPTGFIIELKEDAVLKRRGDLHENISKSRAAVKLLREDAQRLKQSNNLFDKGKGVIEDWQTNSKEAAVAGDETAVDGKVAAQAALVEQEQQQAVAELRSRIRSLRDDTRFLKKYKGVFNGFAVNITLSEAEDLKKFDGVKAVRPDGKVSVSLQQSVPLINADDAWNLGYTGKGVTIGIIDTGVDYTNPELGGCTSQQVVAKTCAKFKGGYDFINNDADPMDDHGHGTHVAATAAGNGTLKGVAPGATLYAYKVLNAGGSGYWSQVIAGIERSVDPNQDGNYADHLNIISLSLGGGGDPDDPVSTAIDNAVSNGVVAVIAAGNSGPGSGTISSPGAARKAITVAAMDKTDTIASFSSRGPVTTWNGGTLLKPDISAPGVSICAARWDSAWAGSECVDQQHIAISGTSMATPHVTGVAALVLQKYPSMTPDDVKALLTETAVDKGYDLYTQGTGRVDALKAITTSVVTSTSVLQLGIGQSASQASASFTLDIRKLSNTTQGYTFDAAASIVGGGLIATVSSPLVVGNNQNTLMFTASNGGTISEGTYNGILMLTAREDPNVTLRLRLVVIVDYSIPMISNHFQNYHINTWVNQNNATHQILWQTDDVSASEIRYRKIGEASFTAARSVGTVHSFATTALSPGEYEYYMTASNSGNLTVIDDNQGKYYRFSIAGTGLIPPTGFSRVAALEPSWDVFTKNPDLNRNGKPELVLLKNYGYGYLSQNGTFDSFESANDGSVSKINTLVVGNASYAGYMLQDTGDADNDGLNEFLVSGRQNNDFDTRLYESASATGMPANLVWQASWPWNPFGRIADLNNDGKKELVFMQWNSKVLTIFTNTGDNSYAQVASTGVPPGTNFALQNFDVCDNLLGDGKKAIVYTGTYSVNPNGSTYTGPNIYILGNTGGYSYAPMWSVHLAGSQFGNMNANTFKCLGDVNGNGKQEFIVGGLSGVFNAGSTFYDYYLFEANGLNSFTPVHVFTFEASQYDSTATAADIDGDGKKDLIFIANNVAYVFKNIGGNSFTPVWYHTWTKPSTVAIYDQAIGAGDLNNDGKSEIVFNEYSGNGVTTGVYSSDAFVSFNKTLYYNLTDDQCTVNLTLSSNTGNHTLFAKYVKDACDGNWDQNISTLAGQAKSLIKAGLDHGNYVVKVVGAGSYVLTQSSSCAKDITKPKVTMAPIPALIKSDYLITASVADSNGLRGCEVCISSDGTCDTEWTATGVNKNFNTGDKTGTCSFNWVVSGYQDAQYTVNFRAEDVAGNKGEGAAQPGTLDRNPPTVSKITVASAIETNALLSVSATVTDVSAISNVTAALGSVTTSLAKNQASGLYEGTIRAPAVSGSYNLVITATDAAGNTGTTTISLFVSSPINWSKLAKVVAGQYNATTAAVGFSSQTGAAVVVWEDSATGRPSIYYSTITPTAQLLTFAKKITDTIYNAKEPAVAVAGDRTHIAWQDDRDGNKEIYYSQLRNGVATVDNARVTFNSFDSTTARVVGDGTLAHIFWIDSRNGGSDLYYAALDLSGNKVAGDVKLTTNVNKYAVAAATGAQNSSAIRVVWTSDGVAYHAYLTGGTLQNIIPVGAAADIAVAAATDSYVLATGNAGATFYVIGSTNGTATIKKNTTLSGSGNGPAVTTGPGGKVNLLWNSPLTFARADLAGNLVIQAMQLQIAPGTTGTLAGDTEVMVLLSTGNGELSMISTATLEKTPPGLAITRLEEVTRQTALVTTATTEPTFITVSYGVASLSLNKTGQLFGFNHNVTLEDLQSAATYSVRVTATDAAGNAQTANSALTTQAQKNRPALPTTFFGTVLESNGNLLAGVTVTAYWTDTDGQNHTTTAITINNGSFLGYYAFNKLNVNARDGSNIRISASDATQDATLLAQPGGSAVNVSQPVIVDKTAPVVTIINPQAGTYSTPFLKLNFTVSEQVNSAKFALNNNAPVTVTDSIGREVNFTAKIGQNTMTVIAVDRIGLVGQIQVAFTVEDKVPPVVATNAVRYVRNISIITANVSDLTNRLDHCEVCAGAGCSWQRAQDDFGSGSMQGHCAYSWDTRSLADGNHDVTFRAFDEAGNVGTAAPVLVKLDNTKPQQIAVTTAPAAKEARIVIHWNPSSDTDFKEYRVYRTSSPPQLIAVIQDAGQTQYNDTTVTSGKEYGYAVVGVDQAGNEGETAYQQAVAPDIVPPTLTISEPQPRMYNTSTVQLNYVASEPLGWCAYSLNGRPPTTISGNSQFIADEGADALILSCNDTSGNQGNALVSFTVDTTAPLPLNVTVTAVPKQNQLVVSWAKSAAADFDHYNIYKSATPFPSAAVATKIMTVANQDTLQVTDISVNSGDTYYYAATATDKIGNENTNMASMKGIVADTIAPVVTIISPQPQLYTAVSIPLRYTTNELISSCGYSLNGNSAAPVAGNTSVITLEGTNTLMFSCNDTAQNTGMASVSFDVDAAIPQNPTVGVSTVVGKNSLKLSWNLSAARDFSQFNVYRSSTPFTTLAQAAKVTATTATQFEDTGLTSQATYYYAITAVDKYGNENTTVRQGSGTVADTIAPNTIILAAKPVAGQLQVALAWNKTDASDFASYTIYRSTSDFNTIGQAAVITTLTNKNTKSYTDAAVASDTRYYYAITAKDTTGNENTAVTTSSASVYDLTPPQVTIVVPENKTYTTRQIPLVVSTNEPTTCTYKLNNAAAQTVVQGITLSALEGGNRVDVTCLDENNNPASAFVLFSTDTIAPPPVTLMSVTAPKHTSSLIINWAANPASDIKEYRVYSMTSNFSTAAPNFLIFATTNISYARTGLISEQKYYAAVTAVDKAGNENTTVSPVAVTIADTNPPPATTGLTVVSIPKTAELVMAWDASPATDAVRYDIYRSMIAFQTNDTAQKIASVSNATTYRDSSLQSQTKYWYGIIAVDSEGNFDKQVTSQSGTTADITPPSVTIASPKQTFIYNTTTVAVQYTTSEPVICTYSLNNGPPKPAANAEIDTATINPIEGTNNLLLACEDLAGNPGNATVSFARDTTPPVPLAITATRVPRKESVTLSWPQTTEPAFSEYTIYRSKSPFTIATAALSLVVIKTKSQTSFTDITVTSEQTYYYAISAKDTAGNENKTITAVSFTVEDLTPPRLAIASPNAGTVYPTSTIPLQYSANEALASCEYSLNGVKTSLNSTSPPSNSTLQVPVLVLMYFPLDSTGKLDANKTWTSCSQGKVGNSPDGPACDLVTIRNYVNTLTQQGLTALSKGSTYHGYKDGGATPYLTYTVTDKKEFDISPPQGLPLGGTTFRPDYYKILNDTDICNYVDNLGVKKVWMFSYHTNIQAPVESNMAMGVKSKTFWNFPTYGDLSNSELTNDMPTCQNTYTLYNYNYARSLGEMLEDQGHDLESVLKFVDFNLFWNKFVQPYGSMQPTVNHCGWMHWTPNSAHDYDWENSQQVMSDCTNWNPDHPGTAEIVDCHTWSGPTCTDDAGAAFKVWWFQNLPGKGNNLTYNNQPIRNWLEFIANFDAAIAKGKTLAAVQEEPTTAASNEIPTISGKEGQNSLSLNCSDLNQNTGLATSTFTINAEAPKPIQGLAASWNGNVQLTWDASTATDVKDYAVYRNSAPFSDSRNAELISTTTTTSYSDADIESEQTYYYAAAAVDTQNNENTTVFPVKVTVPDIVPPLPIQNLTVNTIQKEAALQLNWLPAPEPDFRYYTIYRSNKSFTTTAGAAVLITINSINTTGYKDSGLASATQYFYAITATDNSSNVQKSVSAVAGTVADISIPVITVEQAASPAYGQVTLKAFAADNSLKKSCEVCIGAGCNWQTATSNFAEKANNGTCSYTWAAPADGQTYTYNFRVNDTSDNTAEGQPRQTTTINLNEPVTFTIQLQPGWNLISFPVLPQDNRPTTIMTPLSGKYTRMFHYDSFTKSWQSHFAEESPFNPEETLTTIEAGKAYWVEVNEQASLPVTGSRVPGYTAALNKDWNMIGYPYETPLAMEAAMASLGANYYAIFYYNTTAQKWERYSSYPSVSLPNTFTEMQPGLGYMIDMKTDATWSPPRP